MKILFVCDTMGSGGAERVISTLSNEFVMKGHSVSILMMSLEADESYYALDKRVSLYKLLENNDFSFFKKSNLLKNKIKELKPDIVISFLSYICIYTWWALRKTKIPYIVSERSDPNERGFIKQFLMNQSFRRSAGCVLQTKDALDFYSRVGKEKSVVIHNPVYLPFMKDRTQVNNKIVAAGSLVEAKNYFMLLDAFKFFKDKHNEFTLKIYGDGPLRSELEEYLIKKSLDGVELCHKSKNWLSEESNARIFALSSKTEGMPNVLAEALCVGLPSVATDCPIGGPRELKTIFKERLVLSKNCDAFAFSEALEKALLLNHQQPYIPECLSSNYIANLWLNFLKNRMN